MKGWGYLLALLCGASGGWIAQQFWSSSTEAERAAGKSALARAEARLRSLENKPNTFSLTAAPTSETGEDDVDSIEDQGDSGLIGNDSEAAAVDSRLKQQVRYLLDRQAYMEAVELLYERRIDIAFEQEVEYQQLILSAVAEIEAQLRDKLQWPRLVALYRMLVSLHPDYVPYTLSLVHWLIESGLYDKAEQQLVVARNDVQYANQVEELASRIEERRQIQAGVSQTIDLKRAGAHYLAQVVLNNGETAELLVDTGATLTVIKTSLAEKYALDLLDAEPVTMKTANGAIEGSKVTIENLSMSGLSLDNVELGIVPLPGFKYDGLLGMNVLGRFKFYIDQEQSVLHLQ